MRSLRLARIAAEAEGLRLRRLVRRMVIRAAMGAVASVFLLFALGAAHAAFYFALRPSLPDWGAALVVVGADVVIGGLFGLIAAKRGPGHVEREAQQVSRQARNELLTLAGTLSMAAPVARLFGKRGVAALSLGTLLSRILARRRQ